MRSRAPWRARLSNYERRAKTTGASSTELSFACGPDSFALEVNEFDDLDNEFVDGSRRMGGWLKDVARLVALSGADPSRMIVNASSVPWRETRRVALRRVG